MAQKTFYKADKIQMKWNDSGTNLLVLTQTDVDKTNKSYYGGKYILIYLSCFKNIYKKTKFLLIFRDKFVPFISDRQLRLSRYAW